MNYNRVFIPSTRRTTLRDFTPPGSPPAEMEVTDLKASEAQPLREAEATRCVDWWEEERKYCETPVAYRAVYMRAGMMIIWPCGDHDDEMRAHFNHVGTQRWWSRRWYERVGRNLPPEKVRRWTREMEEEKRRGR